MKRDSSGRLRFESADRVIVCTSSPFDIVSIARRADSDMEESIPSYRLRHSNRHRLLHNPHPVPVPR